MNTITWNGELGGAMADLADEDRGLPMQMVTEAWRLAQADGFETVGWQMFCGYLDAAIKTRPQR